MIGEGRFVPQVLYSFQENGLPDERRKILKDFSFSCGIPVSSSSIEVI